MRDLAMDMEKLHRTPRHFVKGDQTVKRVDELYKNGETKTRARISGCCCFCCVVALFSFYFLDRIEWPGTNLQPPVSITLSSRVLVIEKTQ